MPEAACAVMADPAVHVTRFVIASQQQPLDWVQHFETQHISAVRGRCLSEAPVKLTRKTLALVGDARCFGFGKKRGVRGGLGRENYMTVSTAAAPV